jgi:hypothetical protein
MAGTITFISSIETDEAISITCSFDTGTGIVWTEGLSYGRERLRSVTSAAELRDQIIMPDAERMINGRKAVRAAQTAIQGILATPFTVTGT